MLLRNAAGAGLDPLPGVGRDIALAGQRDERGKNVRDDQGRPQRFRHLDGLDERGARGRREVRSTHNAADSGHHESPFTPVADLSSQ